MALNPSLVIISYFCNDKETEQMTLQYLLFL